KSASLARNRTSFRRKSASGVTSRRQNALLARLHLRNPAHASRTMPALCRRGTVTVPNTHEHTARPPLVMVGLCLAAIYVVWGTTYLAIRIGLQELRPFFMLGTRLVVAGGGFLLVLKILGTPLPTRKQWLNA